MEITDILVLLVIGAILAGAALYICRSRKKGRKCIGCPSSGNCGSCQQNCSCRE